MRAAIRALGVGALLLAACHSFDPVPLDEVPFLERCQTGEREGLVVRSAVPVRSEAKRIFGFDLAKEGIQPVWIEIENHTEEPLVFVESLLDPNHYTVSEAAMAVAGTSPDRLERVRAHFEDLAFGGLGIAAGMTRAGFVFTEHDEATKYVEVVLVGSERVESLSFVILNPDFDAGLRRPRPRRAVRGRRVGRLRRRTGVPRRPRGAPDPHDEEERERGTEIPSTSSSSERATRSSTRSCAGAGTRPSACPWGRAGAPRSRVSSASSTATRQSARCMSSAAARTSGCRRPGARSTSATTCACG